TRFVNMDLGITELNYDPQTNKSVPTPQLRPNYQGNLISLQNSYTYLKTVLGWRPDGPFWHVAHPNAGDWSEDGTARQFGITPPSAADAAIGRPVTETGGVTQWGDYEVTTLKATRTERLTIRVVADGGSRLDPVLLVYDGQGNLISYNDNRAA